MTTSDFFKNYIRQREPEGPTTIEVKVPERGRRKVVKRIDAADIAFCWTDNHNMGVQMADGRVLSVIHNKKELVDLLKTVSSRDLVFYDLGKFYIINLNRAYYNKESGQMVFRIEEKELSIKPSRKAIADLIRQITEKESEVRMAEKQTISVREEGTGSSSLAPGLSGFVQVESPRYHEVQDYVFEDDLAYLI